VEIQRRLGRIYQGEDDGLERRTLKHGPAALRKFGDVAESVRSSIAGTDSPDDPGGPTLGFGRV